MDSLSWRESIAFRRAFERQNGLGTRWGVQFIVMVVIACVLLGISFGTYQIHGRKLFPSWWQVFGLSLGVGFLLAIGLPLIQLFSAYNVRIGKSGIELKLVGSKSIYTEKLKWGSVVSLKIDDQVELCGRRYRALRIQAAGNEEILVGLPDKITIEAIEEVARHIQKGTIPSG